MADVAGALEAQGRSNPSNQAPSDESASSSSEDPGEASDQAPATAALSAGRLGELGSYIRSQRNSAELSLRRLAKLAGVSNPYLSQIERGLRKPSAEILQAIAKALRISAETLYVKAGILDDRPEHDLETEIRRDPYLTEQQRRALIEMYRSFRQLTELQSVDA